MPVRSDKKTKKENIRFIIPTSRLKVETAAQLKKYTDIIPAWCGLEIVRTEKGQEEDDQGLVEFKARALSEQTMVELHEVSRFVKEDGQWLYVAGDIREEGTEKKAGATKKVGRNSPCPCGSGKKFKKCCGS